jgi:hypothetical protein
LTQQLEQSPLACRQQHPTEIAIVLKLIRAYDRTSHGCPGRTGKSLRAALAPVLVAGCALLGAGTAAASNLNFLGRTPLSRYNDADMDLLRGALGKALTSDKMNVDFEFSNPRTGASGVLTPVRAMERDGAPCRDVRAQLRHPQTAAADSVYLLCKRDGRWKLAGPPS